MQTEVERDPFQVFHDELPTLAQKFDELIEAQIGLPGLDLKTKQLVNIGIQTANHSTQGVMWHAMMATHAGATREEVLGAVALNLHLSGLAAVVDALPAALRGIQAAA